MTQTHDFCNPQSRSTLSERAYRLAVIMTGAMLVLSSLR